jgi:hypothetical protein
VVANCGAGAGRHAVVFPEVVAVGTPGWTPVKGGAGVRAGVAAAAGVLRLPRQVGPEARARKRGRVVEPDMQGGVMKGVCRYLSGDV